jgi:hypothetical protein
MLATTLQMRTILRSAINAGKIYTDKCADEKMRRLACAVSFSEDTAYMQALQKRVADAVFLAGFANAVKVTKSAVHGRDGGIVYVRVKALAA